MGSKTGGRIYHIVFTQHSVAEKLQDIYIVFFCRVNYSFTYFRSNFISLGNFFLSPIYSSECVLFCYIHLYTCVSFLFKKDFIYLFLERGEGREKESERNINVWLPLTHHPLGTCPATHACALPENQTSDPLVHRSALSPLSHTSRDPFLFFFFFLL